MNQSFYNAVLPASGPYCVVGIRASSVLQSFHTTIAEVLVQGAKLRADQYNVFFALANFIELGNRKADNANKIRCLFVDLDCGAGKPYAHRDDAAIALREFLTATNLPAPYVVNSGRGIHAYWPFHQEISIDEWAPTARAFKTMCVLNNLHIDLQVTSDPVRILRMIDTENHKVVPALPVQLIAEGVISDLAALVALIPAEIGPVDLSAARAYGMDDMTKQLAGGDYPDTEFARIVRRSLKGKGCAQIAHAVQNAATLEEPLWRSALSVAWRCTDAETAIHMLSRAHPGYSAENTLRKAEATVGPITCDWYRTNSSAICKGCSQTCTSPISIGRKVEASVAVNDVYLVSQQLEADSEVKDTPTVVQIEIPAYPFPYFRGVHGGVYLKTKDKDGDPVEQEIYKYDLYLTTRFYDSDDQGNGDGEVVGVNIHTPHDGIRRFIAPIASLLTKEKMRDILTKHGVVALPSQLDPIMAYIASSIRNLQKMFSADRTRNQFGWTPDGEGFVVGELEYTASGARLAPPGSSTKQLAPMLFAKGNLEDWTKIINFYDRPGMEAHALAVFFGMSAPLLQFIGGMEVRGAAINLMSNKSGTGKTTVQMVVNSFFGHPSELLMKKTDTVPAKMQWLGTLHSIAGCMDEVTNIADGELSELLYDIPQGRGKHRMESQSNRMRANTVSWMTFVLMSSNSSLYDKLMKHKSTSDGEMRRLIELRITRPDTVSKQESDAIFGLLATNFGVAGPVFIQYVMKNKEKVIAQLLRTKQRVDKDLNLDQSDRFYSIVLACAFTFASIGKQLGLHSIDIGRVYKYALTTIAAIRKDVVQPASDTELASQETLTTYINDNLNNALIVNAVRTGGVPQAPIREPRGPLRIRYEPDTFELWIPAAALRDYFVTRQVDFQQAMQELTAAHVLKNNGAAVTKRIGSGAVGNFETMGVRCYCIDGQRIGLDTESFTSNAIQPTP